MHILYWLRWNIIGSLKLNDNFEQFEQKEGFTLLELLCVIVVLSLLFTFSLQVFGSGLMDYYYIWSEVQRVYAFFREARQKAIMTQLESEIYFYPRKNKLVMNSGKQKEAALTLKNGIYFEKESISFGSTEQANFKPLGTGQNGNLILKSDSGLKYKITVYGLTGRVRYERKN